MSKNFVLIGGISHSTPKYPDGIRERFGGGVVYGAKAARALGIKTTVITIGADDIIPAVEDLKSLGVIVHHIKRPTSNNFANDYSGTKRVLQMTNFVAEPLRSDEIAPFFNQDDIYILVPTFKEITGPLMKFFDRDSTVVFDGGLTRNIGPKNAEGFYPIFQTQWESIDEFKDHVSILKVSDEDIVNIPFPPSVSTIEDKLRFLTQNGFPHVVLTQGDKPTHISLIKKTPLIVPVHPISPFLPLDPAGAGDTFNIGYTMRFVETQDPLMAAAFGNACASLKVEGLEITLESANDRTQKILLSS